MPRRLSFEVGVSSSESGSHSSVRILTFFTRSALLNWAMHSARPRSTAATTSGCSAREARSAASMPRLRAHQGDHLQRRLEVGRADVLAPGGDDELLLAVDDAEVALVVHLADVTGVEPALVVEGVG